MRDLEEAWRQGELVLLAPAEQQDLLAGSLEPDCWQALEERWGPGVVVASGGSSSMASGGRRWCLQPLSHLEASARATASWLNDQGIDPGRCWHWNPLPQYHVSGLLPQVRTRLWGARHCPIPAALLRNTGPALAQLPWSKEHPGLISLVPTQLARLLAVPEAVDWLRQLAVIWVGGAALPAQLAAEARRLELPLAPCYGATETAAMVCALPPAQFLAGVCGCGLPLADVQLRLAAADSALAGSAVEVQSPRLSPGFLMANSAGLQPLPLTADGWWRSGDAGAITAAGLELGGRLDGAINSGGETVFPEQLEASLKALAAAAGLPLAELLLVGLPEPAWGERLVALVRADAGASAREGGGEGDAASEGGARLIGDLAQLTLAWPAAERPRRWLICPQLAPTAAGKWQRGHWRSWAAQKLEKLA
ncbi:AMP-binding protein [Cyanobium sp. WAJ14-Wanaka]|uniref:AMP-binding protein n=1 Tax=Cyanobium sp. WAJ14-Wanaka TaxID=2823725 RepID=UPI0020CE65A4|nr:AMP-binding protein [Cyanobium sp. WAJ14-Wanaka]MCP9775374.1 AMP-binding protein [Cyanobium sp. WAJ14-Wanaka]